MERVEGSEVAVVTPVGKDTPITKLSGSYQNIPPNLSSQYRSTPPPYYHFTLGDLKGDILALKSDWVLEGLKWIKCGLIWKYTTHFLALRLLLDMAISYHPSDKYCTCCREKATTFKNIGKWKSRSYEHGCTSRDFLQVLQGALLTMIRHYWLTITNIVLTQL